MQWTWQEKSIRRHNTTTNRHTHHVLEAWWAKAVRGNPAPYNTEIRMMTDETNESLFKAFKATRKRVTTDEDGGMTAYIYLDDQFPKGFAHHGSIQESFNIEILHDEES